MRITFGNNKYMTKSLVILIGIFIFVQYCVLYISLENQKKWQYYNELEKEAIYYTSNLNKNIETLKNLAIAISMDGDLLAVMNNNQNTHREIADADSKINTYKLVNMEIVNIMLYNIENEELFVNSVKYTDPELFPLGDTYELIKNSKEYGIRFEMFCDSIATKASVYDNMRRSVFRILYFMDNHNTNCIIIDVDYDSIVNMFNINDIYENRIVTINNGEKEILTTSHDLNEFFEEIEEKHYIKGETFKINQKKFFCVRNYIDQLKANAYMFVPAEEMKYMSGYDTSVVWIYTTMLLVTAIMLAGMILFKKLYELYRKNREQVMENVDNEKKHFGRIKGKNYLVACFDNPTERQLDKAKEYLSSVKTAGDKTFNCDSLMLIRIDIFNFKGYCSKYNTRDIKLFGYGIKNIYEECILKYCVAEELDISDSYALFLVSVNRGDVWDTVNHIFRDIKNGIHDYIGEQISVFISSIGGMENLEFMYGEITELAKRQFFYSHPVMQYPSEDKEIESLDIDEENEFIIKWKNYFKSDNTGERLTDEIRRFDVAYAKKLLIKILIELSYDIENLKKNGSIINFDLQDHIEKFYNADFVSYCISVFEKIKNEILKTTAREEKKYSSDVSKAVEIIENEYMDSSICVSSIAQRLGFSDLYFPRKFKKEVGESIANYINDVRLCEAARRLVHTDLAAKEIFENVGCENYNYFYVLFKKKYGISPAEYREKFKR